MLQAIKAQIQAQEAEEEEKFRQRMLQKFADDEKTEQMANDKRRMRVQAHKKAVEDLIVKRREERASAKAAEVADINDQKERERLLRETIEKERQRILGEHAARLGLDFLPRGLLANQVCRAALGPPLLHSPLTRAPPPPPVRPADVQRRSGAEGRRRQMSARPVHSLYTINVNCTPFQVESRFIFAQASEPPAPYAAAAATTISHASILRMGMAGSK
jgi:hypothetical protein